MESPNGQHTKSPESLLKLNSDRLTAVCSSCGSSNRLPEQVVPEGKSAAEVCFSCGVCGKSNVPRSSDDEPAGNSGDDALASSRASAEEHQPEAMNAEETPKLDLDRLRVTCWACGLLIQLPAGAVPEGQTAADIRFSCGGCSADNLPHSVNVEPAGCSGTDAPKKSSWFCSVSCQRKISGRTLLCVIPCVIAYVGVASFALLIGVAPGAPRALTRGTLTHIILAVFLETQIFWNYFAAVFTPPGSPSKGVMFGSMEQAKDGRFKEFSLCRRCQVPRPPHAHHCSTCAACIHDLDHHCIFIHNCVGYANRRNFVLFCFYAVLGCSYPLVMLKLTIDANPSAFIRIMFPECMEMHWQRAFKRYFGHRPYAEGGLERGFTPVHNSPTAHSIFQEKEVVDRVFLRLAARSESCVDNYRLVAMSMLLVYSVAVVIAVGSLLLQQVFLLAYATTGLERPSAPLLGHFRSSYLGRFCLALRNIYSYLGSPIDWLCPSLGPLSPESGGKPPPRVLEDVFSQRDPDENDKDDEKKDQ